MFNRTDFILDLCEEIDVLDIRVVDDWRDSAVNRDGIQHNVITQIEFADPEDLVNFFSALHEVGHVKDDPNYDKYEPRTWSDDFLRICRPDTLRCEMAAWQWALDNAPDGIIPDEDTWASIAAGFGSYMACCDNQPQECIDFLNMARRNAGNALIPEV